MNDIQRRPSPRRVPPTPPPSTTRHVALTFATQHSQLLGKLAVLNGSPKFRRSDDWPHGFDNISLHDDRHLLPAITAPTPVMSSTIGQEMPASVSLCLRRTIPHARLPELPGADHFAFAMRPGLVNS